MPTLNLALRLRVIRCAATMLHAFGLQPFSQMGGDVTGTIIAEETRPVDDMNRFHKFPQRAAIKHPGTADQKLL